MEKFAVFIAVLPKDAIESVRDFATMLYMCKVYYFYYDPVTLTGAWVVDGYGQGMHGLDEDGPIEALGWNMRGQTITFLNVDAFRESTHDIDMGQTIAKRHNGTFLVAESLMQCHDYMYSPMYAVSIGSFVTLPEMFQLCFMVPKSPFKSVFAILSDPFDVYCWGAFLFTICMVAVLLSFFGESYRRYNVGLVFLELVMHALNGPSHRFYGRFEVRLVALFMMMNIVLLSCYQSLIISLMSSDRYEPELETIEQINDTCQFHRDIFLQSLGYRFKNTIYTHATYESYEKLWVDKICQMVMCSDLNTGHMLIETQSNTLDNWNDHGLNQYFRYSKARLRSAAVMYLIMNYSPMRSLIERYAAAYSEGHLHHLPLLKARKSSFTGKNTQSAITVVSMRAKDLMIVWFIFLIGCVISFLVFLCELLLIYVPKLCRILGSKLVEETSMKALQQGINRICNVTNLREVFLINNEDASEGSLFISKFMFQRPVTLRGRYFLGSILSETCFVAFITTNKLSEVLRDHMDKSAAFIAVLPNDILESVQKYAARRYICMMYYFHYDPVTYAGSWTLVQYSKTTYELEHFGNGWDLRGQTLTYLNADSHRETLLDSALGQTIAERHNGSFKEADDIMECFDYIYSPTNGLSMGIFTILPELVHMCFIVPRGRFEVRMIGLFMLMNVVLISCYQSLIISLMTSPRYDAELDTIEQVNETCYFQHDVYREILGQRFKNTFRTFDFYGTYEHMWNRKVLEGSDSHNYRNVQRK
ncbi:uncharacterized protein LOC126560619 [Anopheles maculipalpis]|uniref:uncharacterized protein LOC126560619 n=1 Tax=Anopheles maculipalpis TaxID=1496333 RepID=UPI0021594342|nr:uncharacterized protein LOC126560619 [Anopheles maculipalpis]